MKHRENSAERLHQCLKLAKFTTSDSIIVFSGAGMSAESGISTFRDSGGLWDQYPIEEVATPQAWLADYQKVLHFYNLRRKQLLEVSPNLGHKVISQLQKEYNLKIITQNIDDLHERSGATNVLHLHGELRKSRSVLDPKEVNTIKGWALNDGDRCAGGAQLRPHVVWFGEEVPAMGDAVKLAQNCKLMVVVGTSLQVYPAASLVEVLNEEALLVVIDPETVNIHSGSPVFHIREKASQGLALIESVLKSLVTGNY